MPRLLPPGRQGRSWSFLACGEELCPWGKHILLSPCPRCRPLPRPAHPLFLSLFDLGTPGGPGGHAARLPEILPRLCPGGEGAAGRRLRFEPGLGWGLLGGTGGAATGGASRTGRCKSQARADSWTLTSQDLAGAPRRRLLPELGRALWAR